MVLLLLVVMAMLTTTQAKPAAEVGSNNAAASRKRAAVLKGSSSSKVSVWGDTTHFLETCKTKVIKVEGLARVQDVQMLGGALLGLEGAQVVCLVVVGGRGAFVLRASVPCASLNVHHLYGVLLFPLLISYHTICVMLASIPQCSLWPAPCFSILAAVDPPLPPPLPPPPF